MYIQKKSITIILKTVLSLLSLWLLWCIVAQFGTNSFRLFPAWVLVISAAYFLANVIALLFSVKKFNGKIICPMLEGLLLTNFLFMSGVALLSSQFHFYLPALPGWMVFIICVIMPLLTLIDWALFIKKGAWRTISPFYWLALPVCYAATMIFATQVLPDDAELRYPLEIFNYLEFGILPMLGWMLMAAILILIIGYLFYLIDFALSGQLAQKIVLPHIQVVEVDERGNIIREIPSRQTSQSENPVANHADITKPNKASSPQSAKAKSPKDTPKTKNDHPKTKRTRTSVTPEIIKVEIEEANGQTQRKARLTPDDHNQSSVTSANSSSSKKKNQKPAK